MIQLHWIALKTLWIKEMTRFIRIWAQTMLPPVITAGLYFTIFGHLMGSRIGEMQGFSYIQFIVPGLIMMSVINNSYSNVVSSFFSAKFQHSIEELLVAPISVHIIISGYLLGGVVRGIFVGFLVAFVSLWFVPLHIYSWVAVLITLFLTSIFFSLGGLINAIFAKTFDNISFIPTFFITPLIYLGGVFYSLSLLPKLGQIISQINPIVYMISGFRYGFLGIQDTPFLSIIIILIVLTSLFYVWAWKLIEKGYGLRS